jgi:hypothetical protein
MSETTMTAGATATVTLTEYELDPRPDLFADHAKWVAILDLAHAEGDDIWGPLHSLRCGGARLSPSPKYGLVLEPGDWKPEEYAAFKATNLAPRTAQVLRLLGAAANRIKGGSGGAAWMKATTLKEAIEKRVKGLEGRLAAAGWNRLETWSEKEFRADDGHMMDSVFQSLLNDPCWAVGEIRAESVEFRWGPRGREVVNHLYRVSPAVGKQAALMGEGKDGAEEGNHVAHG